MKLNKLWTKLAIGFILLFAVSCGIYFYVNQHTEILAKTNIKTELQNNCLAYDEEKEITLVGTYNNKLMAFDNNDELLWTAEAKGPFCQLIVHSKDRIVYAGNEDNYVYIINLDTGEIINSINAQRRIYSIDVTEDGSEIIVSAGVKTNKHNILIYNSEGEELSNLKFTIRSQGISYTSDEKNIILINNRGEIIKINKEGEELAKNTADYELVSLVQGGDKKSYYALCSDGSYTIYDENLKVLREGSIRESFPVTGNMIGTDSSSENIIVGTKEGYIYISDKKDKQIYSNNFTNTITGITAVKNNIYVTVLGNNVYKISVDTLKNISVLVILKDLFFALRIIFLILAGFSMLIAIPKTKKILLSAGKAIYKYRKAYLLLLPTFLLLFFFNYISVFIAITRAFTNWSKDFNTFAEIRFIGFENFKLMITEGYFLTGLGNLALMLVCGFIKVLTMPLLIAWLVISMKGNSEKYIFRFLFVVPMVVPSIVSTLMWEQIYDPTIGLLNQVLAMVGLENLQRVWLGDEKTAIWAIICMGFPFINSLAFLVYYGGFMGIDASLLESAKVDGAKRWNIFTRIQMPMIMPQIKMMVILTFIGIVQDFSSVYILTGGGPGTSTYVPGLELYYNATKFGRYGYACALGVVMFIFIMIGTIINNRVKSEIE